MTEKSHLSVLSSFGVPIPFDTPPLSRMRTTYWKQCENGSRSNDSGRFRPDLTERQGRSLSPIWNIEGRVFVNGQRYRGGRIAIVGSG